MCLLSWIFAAKGKNININERLGKRFTAICNDYVKHFI